MMDSEKIYMGCLYDQEAAARVYDMAVIQSKGLEAKVNFGYSKAYLLACLFEESII